MRTRARTVLLLASSSVLFGCQPGCETGGLSDLFDTSPTYIRFPGRQLAKGHFSGFRLDGTPGEHGFLLVRDQDEPDQDERGALTVVPIRGAQPCQVGPAADYWPFLSMFGLLRDDQKQIQGYISFLPSVGEAGTPEAGIGTLQFATFDCQVASAALPGVRSPLGTGTLLSPPKFIAIQSDGKLSTVSPWDGTSKSVAESVTDAAFDGSHFWTRQDGQLVVRDSSLSEVMSYGSGVTGYRMDGGGTGYFLDSEGLHRVDGPGKPAALLEPGACGLSTPRGASNYLATLAPCADAELILVDPTAEEKRRSLATGATTEVFATSLRGPERTEQYFIYTTDVAATGLGKLWAVVLEPEQQAPELISEAASMGSLGGAVDGRLPLIVDSDSARGIGRLVFWSPKDGMEEIAKGVAAYNLPLILEKFDAVTGTGTLSFRHANGKLERLASGVPSLPNSRQSFAYRDKDTGKDYNYRAILTEFEKEDDVGNLALISQDGDDLEVSPVADSVPRGAYLFFEFAEALTYLIVDEPRATTGRLEVLFLTTREKFGTDGVSEWMGMDWPEVGIAYAVQEGKQAGIWWGALQ
ncbi:MAG: hypothetical protein JW940_08155 [Polyangiaceae bacterium]|nr:hypothetical protein [Polyangiaceae bacterium]